MKWFLLAFVLIAAGCHSVSNPAEIEKRAHDEEAARLKGINRAQNEQAMREVPGAGITPDMSPSQRMAKMNEFYSKAMPEAFKGIGEMKQKIEQGQDAGQAYREQSQKMNSLFFGSPHGASK